MGVKYYYECLVAWDAAKHLTMHRTGPTTKSKCQWCSCWEILILPFSVYLSFLPSFLSFSFLPLFLSLSFIPTCPLQTAEHLKGHKMLLFCIFIYSIIDNPPLLSNNSPWLSWPMANVGIILFLPQRVHLSPWEWDGVAQSIGDNLQPRPEAVGLGHCAYELIHEAQTARRADFGMKDNSSGSGGSHRRY